MNCWNSSGIPEEFQSFHLFQSFSSNIPWVQLNSTGIPPEWWKDFLVDSEELIDDFLSNMRSKFRPAGPVLTKCRFIIENIQQAVCENYRLIFNTRYWSTEEYRATYFNDYIFYSLKQNIVSKVITNSMTGNSWRFNRFVSINLSVLKLNKEIFR